ncbi:hypothetical protein [Citrobacter sedlakii]|uniref:hypothetical protein n=1 Tax=Citrobacter sedlakii TaxID=67826 RepID=UPI001BAE2E23|nr:hypothetical protein [Citrobacter sedlakii]EKJ8220630.1 hypothetical protein [Citrobacter sedlakii]QUC28412.1 hypothetical protein JY391_12670 [Citrobacter sedlakii]
MAFLSPFLFVMKRANQDYGTQVGIPPDTSARRVAFVISEPEDVGVNEVIFRPMTQAL